MGSLTGVTYTQCGTDNQAFIDAIEFTTGNKYTAKPWIYWQACQLFTQRGYSLLMIKCIKFLQQAITITYHARVRGINKWKFFQLTQP